MATEQERIFNRNKAARLVLTVLYKKYLSEGDLDNKVISLEDSRFEKTRLVQKQLKSLLEFMTGLGLTRHYATGAAYFFTERGRTACESEIILNQILPIADEHLPSFLKDPLGKKKSVSTSEDADERDRLLTHQIQAGERLLTQDRVTKPEFISWSVSNRDALARIYGRDSDIYKRFLPASAGQRTIPEDTPEDDFALKHRKSWIRNNMSLLKYLVSKSEKYNRINIFIAYSEAEEKYRQSVQDHFAVLTREKRVIYWDISEIAAGAQIVAETKKALEAAKVAILLLSSKLLASESIVSNQLPALLKAAEHEGLVLIPVRVKPCSLPRNLAELQFLNPSKALSEMRLPEREKLYVKLVELVDKALGLSS